MLLTICQEQCRENLFKNHAVRLYEMHRSHRETMEKQKKGKAFNNAQETVGGWTSGEWRQTAFKGELWLYRNSIPQQVKDTGKFENKGSL